MRHQRQSGNAIVFILLGIALFAGLAHTFMRGSQQGQGNLGSNQSRLAAQELLSFFSDIDRAVQKLRQRGCSENDISFANEYDNATWAAVNDPGTAPPDKSCHVFDTAGAGMIFPAPPRTFQVPKEQVLVSPNNNENVIVFRESRKIVNIGTAEEDMVFLIDFVDPGICAAYNTIADNGADLSVLESADAVNRDIGDENTTLAGKNTFCVRRNNLTHWSGGAKMQIMYVWSAR